MELATFYEIMIGVLSASALTLAYTIGNYKGFKEAKEFYGVIPGCGK